jgi:pantoate--beta-alanine ligase
LRAYRRIYFLDKKLKTYRANGKTVGFVPTMGALHQGHLSLITQAKEKCDVVVCSIFVNPTQFNDENDLKNYPITINEDIQLLKCAGCDYVFIPSVKTIYPPNLETKLKVDLGFIGTTMEGKFRPGHFDGVIQVVKRLLDIVKPDVLFLGDKDFQQCIVIEKMVQHFGLPVEVVKCATIREKDGLAMSSRNKRLDKESRNAALFLSQYLEEITQKVATHPLKELINYYYNKLNEHPLIRVEYLEVVDSIELSPISEVGKATSARVLVAAYVGGVRLIDNKAMHNFVVS